MLKQRVRQAQAKVRNTANQNNAKQLQRSGTVPINIEKTQKETEKVSTSLNETSVTFAISCLDELKDALSEETHRIWTLVEAELETKESNVNECNTFEETNMDSQKCEHSENIEDKSNEKMNSETSDEIRSVKKDESEQKQEICDEKEEGESISKNVNTASVNEENRQQQNENESAEKSGSENMQENKADEHLEEHNTKEDDQIDDADDELIDPLGEVAAPSDSAESIPGKDGARSLNEDESSGEKQQDSEVNYTATENAKKVDSSVNSKEKESQESSGPFVSDSALNNTHEDFESGAALAPSAEGEEKAVSLSTKSTQPVPLPRTFAALWHLACILSARVDNARKALDPEGAPHPLADWREKQHLDIDDDARSAKEIELHGRIMEMERDVATLRGSVNDREKEISLLKQSEKKAIQELDSLRKEKADMQKDQDDLINTLASLRIAEEERSEALSTAIAKEESARARTAEAEKEMYAHLISLFCHYSIGYRLLAYTT